jgi:hypothetical protein
MPVIAGWLIYPHADRSDGGSWILKPSKAFGTRMRQFGCALAEAWRRFAILASKTPTAEGLPR